MFTITYVSINLNPPFQELNAVNDLKLMLSMSLRTIDCVQSDFESEYLFRTCSLATNLVTALSNPFKFAVLLYCVILVNYWIIPCSILSLMSVALLRAVLQVNTEPLRNALVKMRNQILDVKNGLGTRQVPSPAASKWRAVSLHVSLSMNPWILLYYSDEFQYFCPIEGKLLYFVYAKIYCVLVGISRLMSFSNGLDAYIFRRNREKTRFLREELDGKLYISGQSRHFLCRVKMIEVLFLICILTWRVNNFVSRQRKSKNRRNGSAIPKKNFSELTISWLYRVWLVIYLKS